MKWHRPVHINPKATKKHFLKLFSLKMRELVLPMVTGRHELVIRGHWQTDSSIPNCCLKKMRISRFRLNINKAAQWQGDILSPRLPLPIKVDHDQFGIWKSSLVEQTQTSAFSHQNNMVTPKKTQLQWRGNWWWGVGFEMAQRQDSEDVKDKDKDRAVKMWNWRGGWLTKPRESSEASGCQDEFRFSFWS